MPITVVIEEPTRVRARIVAAPRRAIDMAREANGVAPLDVVAGRARLNVPPGQPCVPASAAADSQPDEVGIGVPERM